jgi:hypothetical protein
MKSRSVEGLFQHPQALRLIDPSEEGDFSTPILAGAMGTRKMLWSAASALRARIRPDSSSERCAGRKNPRKKKTGVLSCGKDLGGQV